MDRRSGGQLHRAPGSLIARDGCFGFAGRLRCPDPLSPRPASLTPQSAPSRCRQSALSPLHLAGSLIWFAHRPGLFLFCIPVSSHLVSFASRSLATPSLAAVAHPVFVLHPWDRLRCPDPLSPRPSSPTSQSAPSRPRHRRRRPGGRRCLGRARGRGKRWPARQGRAQDMRYGYSKF